MPRHYKRRKRFRRRKGRKMSFRRRVKKLIKANDKKHTEMKYVEDSVALTTISLTGTLTPILSTAPAIPVEGTGSDERIGADVNIWRIMMQGYFVGPIGLTAQTVLRVRAMIFYSRLILLPADLPSTIDQFMNDQSMKQKGIYIVSDRTFSLSPQLPSTVITAADGVVYTSSAARPTRTFKKKLRFRGRKTSFDAGGGTTTGFYSLWTISEQNLAGERCRFFFNIRTYFTDP